MGSEPSDTTLHDVRNRPGGMPLLVVLPRSREIEDPGELLRMVEVCRPHAVLPFHQEPDPIDLRTLLREPPHDLPQAVVDYLGWRGLVLDPEMRNLIRRTIELSGDLRTVSGLARGVYMSRRALGRAFLREGLPVPSHWLHLGRLLRVVLDIQWRGDTLMKAASAHGYPDGFSLSNQMARLIGVRPSTVKERIGWEWVFETWILREVEQGGFSSDQADLLARGIAPTPGTEGAQTA
jgi:AraC-like DNA-binding protein